MNKIENFLNKGFCVGCGLCKSIFANKVKLKVDKNGNNIIFLDDLNKDELKWFERYCPAINQYEELDKTKNNSNVFGPYISFYLGNSVDDKIRFSSSTGGIVTSLIMYLIDQKLVDAVLYIGEDKNSPLFNTTIISTDSEEIKENVSGSRYSPTSLLSNINNVLEKYEKVAIVGKGCEIRALDNLLKNYNYNQNNIYKIAIFCGGTPSICALHNICKDFSIDIDDIKNIRFRGNGWPGKFVISKKDNTEFKMNYRDSWVNYLSKEISLGCKLCFDGLGNCSDISTGDAWYGAKKDGYPSFDEGDGRNLIIARTIKGRDLLLKTEKENIIHLEQIDIDENIELMQPSQSVRRKSAYYKIFALRLMNFKYPFVNINLLKLIRDRECSVIKKTKYILGMMKRTYSHIRRIKK